MSETNLPAVNTDFALTLKNNLTVNDILSVAVGKVEDSLRSKLRQSQKNSKALEASLKKLNKKIEDTAKALQDTCGLSAELKELEKPLKKLFPHSTFPDLMTPNISIDRVRAVVTFSYSIGNRYGREAREVSFTDQITQLFADLDQLRDNLTLENTEEISIRSKLANIPALERRYRGLIAEQQLQKSDQGKEILDTLTLNLDDEIERL